ncbi:hypothetical protein [Amycolatopsis sp. NPDC051128]|uniref:hypothetical protein n=1 Tax=Amycolatopsis sp. NPDC051128 TaxID=3155412 RepID=UPI003449FBC2
MNRAHPVAAAVLTVAGLALVAACGTNPYATSGAVQPVVLGAQQQPVSAVPAGSGAAITPTGEKVTGSDEAAQSSPAAPTTGGTNAGGTNTDGTTTAGANTVGTTDIGGLGPVLTDKAGNTLYLFTKDGKDSGKSTCDGACARKWPPVAAGGRITVAESIDTGLIGQIRRTDGTMQVTVGGWPVYTYSQDGAPGEATGHGVGNTWYAVEPNGCKVDSARRPDARQAIATSSSGGY